MGKAPVVVRNYKIGDPELKQACDTRSGHLTRDAEALSKRGIKPETKELFDELIADFENEPTDDEFKGALTLAVAEKDAAAEDLRSDIRMVRSMAFNTYGEQHGHYKSFSFKGMDDMKGAELVFLGKKVKRVGKKLLKELKDEGLTMEILDAIEAKAITLDKKLDLVEDTIEDRDIATQRRIVKGNKLHAEYVRLSNIGQSVFAEKDEARYNDYVMNDTPSAGNPPTAPEV